MAPGFRGSTRPALAVLVVMFCWTGTPARANAQVSGTVLAQALDRAVLRVNSREDLRNHRQAGFNRDSFDVHAFRGLGKADDSTVAGWFSGFSAFIGGTDSAACGQLVKMEPTGTALAAVPSTMDSVAVEDWVKTWESAVAASYLAPERAPPDQDDLMMAMLGLLAQLPHSEVVFNAKPNSKPSKPNPQQECSTMREFFHQALLLKEPARMTLLRGLAQMLREKSGSSPLGKE